MRIVVDAMGTDACPTPDVEGAILAARAYKDDIILVGKQSQIDQVLHKHDINGLSIKVVHSEQLIQMTDKPSDVMRSKPQSSMHIGMELVRKGEADAFVTMGNTGAAHAIATLVTLRRITGIKRPALTAIYPIRGKSLIFADVGANADCKPDWLVQFAMMGTIYAEKVLKRQDPRVATLSNGEEEGKGNQLVRDTQALLQATSLNYVGHIEPKEILMANADVIIVDGFVGNVFMKTFEAAISYFSSVIREEVMVDIRGKLGGLAIRPALQRVRQRIDPDEFTGAPLLGVNGVVIIGHGGSDANAVKNAINQARQAVIGDVVNAIKDGLADL